MPAAIQSHSNCTPLLATTSVAPSYIHKHAAYFSYPDNYSQPQMVHQHLHLSGWHRIQRSSNLPQQQVRIDAAHAERAGARCRLVSSSLPAQSSGQCQNMNQTHQQHIGCYSNRKEDLALLLCSTTRWPRVVRYDSSKGWHMKLTGVAAVGAVCRGNTAARPPPVRQSAAAASTYGFTSRRLVIPGAMCCAKAPAAISAPVTPAAPSVWPKHACRKVSTQALYSHTAPYNPLADAQVQRNVQCAVIAALALARLGLLHALAGGSRCRVLCAVKTAPTA